MTENSKLIEDTLFTRRHLLDMETALAECVPGLDDHELRLMGRAELTHILKKAQRPEVVAALLEAIADDKNRLWKNYLDADVRTDEGAYVASTVYSPLLTELASVKKDMILFQSKTVQVGVIATAQNPMTEAERGGELHNALYLISRMGNEIPASAILRLDPYGRVADAQSGALTLFGRAAKQHMDRAIGKSVQEVLWDRRMGHIRTQAEVELAPITAAPSAEKKGEATLPPSRMPGGLGLGGGPSGVGA